MSDSEASPDVTIEITVGNDSGHDLTLAIEPWGEHHPMPHGKVFRLVGVGQPGKIMNLGHADDFLTVWSEGSELRVYDGDVEIFARSFPADWAAAQLWAAQRRERDTPGLTRDVNDQSHPSVSELAVLRRLLEKP